jgi:hypothetical protein
MTVDRFSSVQSTLSKPFTYSFCLLDTCRCRVVIFSNGVVGRRGRGRTEEALRLCETAAVACMSVFDALRAFSWPSLVSSLAGGAHMVDVFEVLLPVAAASAGPTCFRMGKKYWKTI